MEKRGIMTTLLCVVLFLILEANFSMFVDELVFNWMSWENCSLQGCNTCKIMQLLASHTINDCRAYMLALHIAGAGP